MAKEGSKKRSKKAAAAETAEEAAPAVDETTPAAAPPPAKKRKNEQAEPKKAAAAAEETKAAPPAAAPAAAPVAAAANSSEPNEDQGAYDETEKEWIYELNSTSRLRVCRFKGNTYVDIRKTWQGKPSTKGIFMPLDVFRKVQGWTKLDEAVKTVEAKNK